MRTGGRSGIENELQIEMEREGENDRKIESKSVLCGSRLLNHTHLTRAGGM